MKEYIPWSDELSVGIQEIDEQHKILVNLVNRLYEETIIKRAHASVVEEVLRELVEYTIIHFAVEESLFRIFDYPFYDQHKKQHDDLKKQVIDIQKKFITGEASISIELLGFLRKWVRDHIMVSDNKYRPFFLEKGVKGTWSKRSWIGKIWDSIR